MTPQASPTSQPTKILETNNDYLVGLYTMFYRDPERGSHVQFKHFRFHGKLREAIDRASKHCGIMGFKYMFTEPLIRNLEADEKLKLGNLDMNQIMADRAEHEKRAQTAFGQSLPAQQGQQQEVK